MKVISLTVFFGALIICTCRVASQKADTVQVTSANINTKVLREGTHR